jgi:hypothetical protein
MQLERASTLLKFRCAVSILTTPPEHSNPQQAPELLVMLTTWGLRAVVLAIYLGSAYLVNVEVKEPYLVSIHTRCGPSSVPADTM